MKIGAGIPLFVSWHQNKAERINEFKKKYVNSSQQTNLYIKNLKLETTEQDVNELFSQFGAISSIKIQEWKAPNGTASKFGFIDFKSESDCYNAHHNVSNNPEILKLFIGQSPYVGFYQSRVQRNKYLSMKNNHIFFNPLVSLNPRPSNQFSYKPSYNPLQQQNFGYYSNQNQNYNNYNQKYPRQQQYSNQYQDNKYNYKKRPYEQRDYQPKLVAEANKSQKTQEQPRVEVNNIYFIDYSV